MVLGIASGKGKGGGVKQNISADVGFTRPKDKVVVDGLLLVHVSF